MTKLTITVAPSLPHSHIIDCSPAEFAAWLGRAMYRLSTRDLRLEPEEDYDDPDDARPYVSLWAAPADCDETGEPFWSFEVWPVKHDRVEVKVWDDMAPPALRTAFNDLLEYQLTPVHDRPLVDAEGNPEPQPERPRGGRPPGKTKERLAQEEQVRNLHKLGLSDAQMAVSLRISRWSARDLRVGLDLPANYEPGGKPVGRRHQ